MPTLTLEQPQLWIDVMSSFAVFDTHALHPSKKTEYKAIRESVKNLAIADRVSKGGDLAGLSRL